MQKEIAVETTERRTQFYMNAAIRLAKKAAAAGDVPIGCVIVCKNHIIGRGYNRRSAKKCALEHAELMAIRQASRFLGDWRLEECTLYVTLEPCQMCAGAIVQARIPRVVIGTDSPKAGCAGSIVNLLQNPRFNHQAEITRGVCEEVCAELLREHFRILRKSKKG